MHAALAKHAKYGSLRRGEQSRVPAQGFAVDDFLKPDRVVVGTSSARAQKVMEDLYKPSCARQSTYFMDERSAEG